MSGVKSKFKFSRVMLIDDNPIDLYIAGKIIANNHFGENVLSFNSVNDALDFLEQHQDSPEYLPEIIFVDIYMPVLSGFDFLVSYGQFPLAFKSRCRVFVVSSSIDENDIQLVNQNKNVAGFAVKTMTKNFLDSIVVVSGKVNRSTAQLSNLHY